MTTIAERYVLEGWRQKGMAAALLRLLRLEFGNVPPSLVGWFNSVSGAELDA